MTDKKDTDDWMGILPDAERAAVLKTQIQEAALTERERISQAAATDRDFGTQFVRGLAAIGLAAVAMAAIYAYVMVKVPGALNTPSAAPSSNAPQQK